MIRERRTDLLFRHSLKYCMESVKLLSQFYTRLCKGHPIVRLIERDLNMSAAGDGCVIPNDLGIHTKGVARAIQCNVRSGGKDGSCKGRATVARNGHVCFIGRRDVDEVVKK